VGFVYILRCRDGTLYTGATKDLDARLRAHGSGRASKYTRSRLPVTLVYWRRLSSWRRALKEERRIKDLTRSEKLALLADLEGRTSGARGRLDKGRGPES
jgi:putative endonuclease